MIYPFLRVLFLILGLCSIQLFGSVSSPNPFLRPGGKQKPSPVQTNKIKQKPIPQKDMSKEIEFRGYFILKGKPFFCLLNKKSNHAEWISLTENTYEEFKAHEFDMSSEVLTVLYEGVPYELSLLQGRSSVGSNKAVSEKAKPSFTPSISSIKSTPKYMPPRPKTPPKLPPWLVNKKSTPSLFPSSNTGMTTNGIAGAVPRRIVPSFPFPVPNSQEPTRSNFQTNPAPLNPTAIASTPEVSNSVPSPSSNSASDIGNVVNQGTTNLPAQNNTLDLDSLPPPPPPPNITPPTPPPNILPSREN